MDKLKHSKCAIVSFLLAIIPLIFAIIITIMDIINPVNTFSLQPVLNFYIMNFIFFLYLVSFVLGIVGVRKKSYKKKLAVSAIIISGLVLLIPIIMYIKIFIEILNR